MESASEEVKVAGWNTLPQGWLEAESPFHWFKENREVSPVMFDEQRNTWDIFRYEDIKNSLMNYKAFSSELLSLSIIGMDPPKHKLYRSIVSKAFTPKIVEEMAPMIEQVTNELLDSVLEEKKMDFIQDFAYPLPVIIISEMMGIPKEDRDQFKYWSDELIRGIDIEHGEKPEDYKQMKAKISQEMSKYFINVIEVKRIHPGNDLVSALLAAKIDEHSLDFSEILQFCLLLLVAGNETTTNLLGNTMKCLLDIPGLQQQLHSEPALIPSTLEEVLRFRSPIQSLTRICKEDTVLSGQTIKAGDHLVLWLGSANRDEEQFEQPETFIPSRKPNQHMAFGMGPHFCLGAPLSRLEAKIAFEIIFKRIPVITPADHSTAQFIKDPLVHGFKSIPIQY
ncbi:cytochrome P450 [Paenibacillus sp. Marseille-Q4541]|uniref:cytochrome P450 n=1 Tax=Paenibacillus sp. Marseille-Q4541 TaxID=2831522 RepID=UPI001BAD245B|nr:cytochrome P450 [Paenibacillus sp. Marseille-Q4541]